MSCNFVMNLNVPVVPSFGIPFDILPKNRDGVGLCVITLAYYRVL